MNDLAAQGIVSKCRVNTAGRATGGAPYRRSALYALLANRLYLGETVHKGVAHPGEHDVIVDQGLWDEVQSLLAANRVIRRHQGNANDPSLLTGMIRDSHGRRMSPRHAGKVDRRYRYYVSVAADGRPTKSSAPIVRIAAGEIEAAIFTGVTRFLTDPAAVLAAVANDELTPAQMDVVKRCASNLAEEISSMAPSQLLAFFAAVDLQVIIDGDAVSTTVGRPQLAAQVGVAAHSDGGSRCTIPVPDRLLRTGNEMRLAIAPASPGASTSRDGGLVAPIAKAHQARDLLMGQGAAAGAATTVSHRHLTRLARLSYLAPDIIGAILQGRQPRTMTSRSLLRMATIPLDWDDQRRLLRVR